MSSGAPVSQSISSVPYTWPRLFAQGRVYAIVLIDVTTGKPVEFAGLTARPGRGDRPAWSLRRFVQERRLSRRKQYPARARAKAR
jgi:hypothetical protein